MGDISYDDSYISTIYPSFNTLKALRIIEPEKELSIVLAKIDFAIDELPYPINKIPLDNLIELVISLQRIIKLEPRLRCLFASFYRTRFDKLIESVIIESIFSNGYNGIYSYPNNECLTKVNILLALIYNMNDPLNRLSVCTLFVSDSISIRLLRCLKSMQISLLEHINEKPEHEYDTHSIFATKSTKTYLKVFQRNNERYEYICLTFVLVNRLLELVEGACNPSYEVFNYFYELLKHDYVISTSSFCSEVMLLINHLKNLVEYLQAENINFDDEFKNIRHCLKLIITSLHTKQKSNLKTDEDFTKLLVMYIRVFQDNKTTLSFRHANISNNSSKKTVLKHSQKINKVDSTNYRYHLENYPKEPEWVKNFYDLKSNNDMQFQSSRGIVNKDVIVHNSLDVASSSIVKQGVRAKIRNMWIRSLKKYRKRHLIDQNCKKCKYLPFHYLYHKSETDIYIEL